MPNRNIIPFRALPKIAVDILTGLITILPLDETTGSIAYDAHGSNNFTNSNEGSIIIT